MSAQTAVNSAPLDALLAEVLGRPREDRPAFLDLLCRDDGKLRAELEGLMAAHEEATGFLERPAVEADPALETRLTEGPGTTVGRYRLLQLIGEGGFGAVYMAEQREPLKRKVALKIIKLGMDTKQVIARFEAERQALAMMDHPNIARVLDAGATDTGRPYFVMELVKGIPITAYCDRNNLSTAERLEIFVQVCNAVQHAHQKGIIHRDLKPSNTMVTLHDGTPVTKVIDFGIAKAINRELTDKTLFTEFRQFLGTPEYMSPEQAEMSGLDIDTRSDIYSLGVLLYELLTGTTPFDARKLRDAGYNEIQRIIREEEPLRPSTRLSTLGDELTGVAKHRHTEPKALRRILRGDLDWIVMKALEKDRTRRYDTANDLAADVRRYLSSEAVLATPPSPPYRLRKFVRRHRAAVTAASAVAAALVAWLAIARWSFAQACQQRDRAQHEADRAEAVSGFLQAMLASVDPATTRGREFTVRSMLDEAGRRLDEGAIAHQPQTEAAVRQTIGETYESLGLHPAAVPHLRRALGLRLELLGEAHADTQRTISQLAQAYLMQERHDEAAPLIQTALEVRTRALGAEHPDTLDAMYYLGWCRFSEGRGEEGEALFRKIVEIRRKVFGEDDLMTAEAWNCLGVIYIDGNKWNEAEPCMTRAYEIGRRSDGADHPVTLKFAGNVASVYINQGRLEEAESLLRETIPISRSVLGPSHERTLSLLESLIDLYKTQGRPEEGRDWVRQAIEARRQQCLQSSNDPVALNDYAWLLVSCEPADLRNPKEALKLALRANALADPENHDSLVTLARACFLNGDLAGAIEQQRKAVAMLPAGRPDRLELEEHLAEYEKAAVLDPALSE